MLAEVLASIRALLDSPLSGAIRTADQRWVIDDHQMVIEAIRYRDAEMARSVMTHHMQRIESALRAFMDDQPTVSEGRGSKAGQNVVDDIEGSVHVSSG